MEKERRIRIFNFILYSLAIALLLYIFIDYSFIQEIPNCQLSFNNFSITNNSLLLKINGSSMSPEIKDGSECICSEKDEYDIGDIIVFSFIEEEQMFTVIHRIIGINDINFITRGDKNNFTDSFSVPKEAILCAVENKHRISLTFI